MHCCDAKKVGQEANTLLYAALVLSFILVKNYKMNTVAKQALFRQRVVNKQTFL